MRVVLPASSRRFEAPLRYLEVALLRGHLSHVANEDNDGPAIKPSELSALGSKLGDKFTCDINSRRLFTARTRVSLSLPRGAVRTRGVSDNYKGIKVTNEALQGNL